VGKSEFADDVALLATDCAAAEEAIQSYAEVAKQFDMTVSILKTKFMVVGHGIEDGEWLPIAVYGCSIDCVSEFPYLGSVIEDNARIDVEVDRRITSASIQAVSNKMKFLFKAVFTTTL